MTLLLSVTIKIALLTLAALAATVMLRRRSAAMRHWVLATTMVVLSVRAGSWKCYCPRGRFPCPLPGSHRPRRRRCDCPALHRQPRPQRPRPRTPQRT